MIIKNMGHLIVSFALSAVFVSGLALFTMDGTTDLPKGHSGTYGSPLTNGPTWPPKYPVELQVPPTSNAEATPPWTPSRDEKLWVVLIFGVVISSVAISIFYGPMLKTGAFSLATVYVLLKYFKTRNAILRVVAPSLALYPLYAGQGTSTQAFVFAWIGFGIALFGVIDTCRNEGPELQKELTLVRTRTRRLLRQRDSDQDSGSN